MLSISLIITALFYSALAVVLPEQRLDKRFTNYCVVGPSDTDADRYPTEAHGSYTFALNGWGIYQGSGQQCAQVTSASGSTIAWATTYNWSGGPNDVKTYSNIQLSSGLPIQVSAVSSIPSTWHWSYSSASSDLRADVSYDIFLSNSATAGQYGGIADSASTVEIMIWLGCNNCVTHGTSGGITPVSFTGSPDRTSVTLGGFTWDIWTGSIGANGGTWNVYSFVAHSDLNGSQWDSKDLNVFLQYLVTNYSLNPSQYIRGIQSGTEPFTGSATLVTSSYSVSVNAGGNGGGSQTGPPASQQTHYGQCGGTLPAGAPWPGPYTCQSPYICTPQAGSSYEQCL